jgi:hypothetical protein
MKRKQLAAAAAAVSLSAAGACAAAAVPAQAGRAVHVTLTASTAHAWQVRPGDTYSKIAAAVCGNAGRWPVVAAANRYPATSIPVGATLRVPCSGYSRAVTTAAHRAPVHRASGWRQIAAAVFGAQAGCADAIIVRESGGRVNAANPYSGAYGIPQALPGSKMASAGADWRWNPWTQLRWMRSYVDAQYGGACAAWSFWRAHGSY